MYRGEREFTPPRWRAAQRHVLSINDTEAIAKAAERWTKGDKLEEVENGAKDLVLGERGDQTQAEKGKDRHEPDHRGSGSRGQWRGSQDGRGERRESLREGVGEERKSRDRRREQTEGSGRREEQMNSRQQERRDRLRESEKYQNAPSLSNRFSVTKESGDENEDGRGDFTKNNKNRADKHQLTKANGDYSPMKMLVDNLKSKNVKSADDRKRRSEDPVPYKKKHSSPSSSSSDRSPSSGKNQISKSVDKDDNKENGSSSERKDAPAEKFYAEGSQGLVSVLAEGQGLLDNLGPAGGLCPTAEDQGPTAEGQGQTAGDQGQSQIVGQGQIAEGQDRLADVPVQRIEDQGQTAEDLGQTEDGHGQIAEDLGPTAEDQGQIAEDQGQGGEGLLADDQGQIVVQLIVGRVKAGQNH
ncbi:hypothetical protein EB796_020660 [Bugula neritina]|uniref:Uncharacterized protein n=1 Tax=Bugula neritina TaxID=10212 RepID=A0A7J7J4I1_BUGNE|nr:hypothetical protein EB796_020660 [Bugula neritina]